MKGDNLGDRMKGYESTSRYVLLRRSPVIIRVDGKAFHTFTKQITEENDPSSAYGPSERMHRVMVDTMCNMFNSIQNCVFGYTQSDEISFLLKDWNKLESEQWFNANLQKIASVAASMATMYFAEEWENEFEYMPRAFFDARAFNVPMEEVVNYFIWRQQDATRNSVQFIGRKHFSHRELHGKNNSEIQEMLWKEHDCNWNDYAAWKKRGSCIYKSDTVFNEDDNIPIFTQDREYIGRHLEPDNDE